MSEKITKAFGGTFEWLSRPRRQVEVHLPDGRTLLGDRGSQLGAFLFQLDDVPVPILGGIVNGALKELTYPIEREAQVRPVSMAEADGMRIYRRSLTFLLATAFEEMFPDSRLNVDHSIASGGYFCQVAGRAPLTQAELDKLDARMKEMVEEDLPISKMEFKLEEAIEYFKSKGYEDKVSLLAHRTKRTLVIYRVLDHFDYHHGYMVPSTGVLRWFSLDHAVGGFTLRFPRRHQPTELLGPPEYPKLLAAFRRYGDWLETIGIRNIGALNDALVNQRGREIVLVAEALHERRIAEIAAQIAEGNSETRIVLIAGPSASGKTTFSKRLSIQLMAQGLSPYPIELDNFFVNRDETPRDEDGELDYESLHALDLPRLNHDLRLLVQGERVQIPSYDFVTGLQSEGKIIQLVPDQILIFEGIHGLNPELIPAIPPEQTFRVYASALTQLNLDSYNRVSTTDTRLIRRIVRDAQHRGYSASDTIRRWESVRRGEKRYIFPYQENADVMFNSALVYEGAALAPMAEPLLRQVTYGTDEHVEAKRLLALLRWFLPIDPSLIPDNSILREFVGGSILREFSPWQPAAPNGR
ncbi:MAG: nucleoside kinase [Anaerolineales bacterium]